MSAYNEFIAWEKSTETIDFKMIYVDISGDLIAGLLLSQIIYWHLPDRNGKQKIKKYVNDIPILIKKRSEWKEEIRISEKQYDRAIGILEERKIVKVENHKSSFHENNIVPHIYLNFEVLESLKQIELDKIRQGVKSGFPKGQSGKVADSPKVNPEIDQKVNSLYTENTSENTFTKNTRNNESKDSLSGSLNPESKKKHTKVKDTSNSNIKDILERFIKIHKEYYGTAPVVNYPKELAHIKRWFKLYNGPTFEQAMRFPELIMEKINQNVFGFADRPVLPSTITNFNINSLEFNKQITKEPETTRIPEPEFNPDKMTPEERAEIKILVDKAIKEMAG